MESLQILKDKAETCAFCKLKEINELKYGPLYKRNGLVAHYYCVLFSYRVIQNGADDEGILGFLIRDIKIELKRVRNVICDYCSKPNASVYCCRSHCKRTFHFPCGIVRKSLHQFKGSFKSFCFDHRPRQKIPLKFLTEAQRNQPKCVICYDDLDYSCETDVLWANCCLKTWYHRDCLQKFALSSGYLFKCAICNNKRQFKQWVEEYGIFVPKQDASWELEPNAFSELLVQHGRCDATHCVCPFGREFSSNRQYRQWDIILCKSCGSQGIHPACSNVGVKANWECDLCKLVRTNLREKRSRRKTSVRPQQNNSNRSASYLMSGNEDSRNDATSSYSRNIISLQTVTSEGRIIRSRTERKRKRTEAEEENSDLKKTAFEDNQNQDQESQTCFEKASTTGYGHSSTSPPNFHAHEVTDDEAVDIEDISTEASDEDEEIIVDGPEVSYVGTSSNNDIEEFKRRDQDILIIDLTESTSADKDEMLTVMETYRTIQLSDVRYRVKKEVYVVSDDEDNDDRGGNKKDDGDETSADNELEVILHKNNSNDFRKTSIIKSENDTRPSLVGAPRNCTKSDVSLVVEIEDDPPNEGKRWKTEGKTSKDGSSKKKEDGEVEVLEVSDEANSKTEAKSKSNLKNESPQSGSSSRATGSSDKKRKSEFIDKYFFIFLEEKTKRNRLDRLSKDIKKVIVNHRKKYGSKHSKSSRKKQSEEDDDSHITVSSDSESEYSCKEVFDDRSRDDDDDVQIISSASD